MRLFHCEWARVEADTEPMVVPTPLGTVRVAVSLNGVSLGPVPRKSYTLDSGGRIASWQHPDIDLDVLLCRPLFSPPLDLPVDECWGVLWRGQARAVIDSVVLSAAWHDGGPDGGQYLYAITWTDGKTEVTIGTQDDEMLALRAQRGDSLPVQWEPYFVKPQPSSGSRRDSGFFEHPVHCQLLPTGIACPFPSLEAGQSFQIAFGIAWADTDSASPAATSLAVEASPAQILAGGGCT